MPLVFWLNLFLFCVALTAKPEAAGKALAKERSSRQIVDQALQAS
jgi:hypothetical protein